MVVLLGLDLAADLSFLVGLSLFLFSAILDSFLIWGFVSGKRGLVSLGLRLRSHFSL